MAEISATLDILAPVSWLGENLLSSQPKQTPSRKAPYQLDLEEGISVVVTHRKMKNLRLSIRADDGIVRLSVPTRATRKAVRDFAEVNLPWIRKQLIRLRKTGQKKAASFLSGEDHPLWGQPYKLHVIERNGRPRVVLSGEVIQLYINASSTIGDRQRLLNHWYRRVLRARIPSLLSKWEAVVGRTAQGWTIRDMRTRWGTCNTTRGLICLNLALAKKPVEFLEFIIVHELTHLHERNHNKRFYALMDRFMPGWKNHSRLEVD